MLNPIYYYIIIHKHRYISFYRAIAVSHSKKETQ